MLFEEVPRRLVLTYTYTCEIRRIEDIFNFGHHEWATTDNNNPVRHQECNNEFCSNTKKLVVGNSKHI